MHTPCVRPHTHKKLPCMLGPLPLIAANTECALDTNNNINVQTYILDAWLPLLRSKRARLVVAVLTTTPWRLECLLLHLLALHMSKMYHREYMYKSMQVLTFLKLGHSCLKLLIFFVKFFGAPSDPSRLLTRCQTILCHSGHSQITIRPFTYRCNTSSGSCMLLSF